MLDNDDKKEGEHHEIQTNHRHRRDRERSCVPAGRMGQVPADLAALYDSGLVHRGILLPAVFGKSPKSKNGSLESRAGFKGLCRKTMTLFYVYTVAHTG